MLNQLKQKDVNALKEKWYKEQGCVCPLFGKEYPLDKVVLDHQHKLKAELPDETGKGLCRGVIHFQANSIEGKITNAFKRYGGPDHIDLITYLRNLADYLEHNKIHTDEKFIHPSEEPRAPKLMKSSYNKLVKTIQSSGKKVKVPEFTGKFTKALAKLFESHQIKPMFHEKRESVDESQ